VRKSARRGSLANRVGRVGSRSGSRQRDHGTSSLTAATTAAETATSAIQPSAILLDNLGMHFSTPRDAAFALGDFPRRHMPGVEGAAEDDPWKLL
jgi:hypothetical protein